MTRIIFHHFVKQVLQETLLCDKHPHGNFKEYYDIDVNNPPSISDILETWVINDAQIDDSCVNRNKPTFYSTNELTPYREYSSSELRNGPGTERYEMLKNSISKSGIEEPIILALGRNGIIKICEGNHRHQIAMELGIKMVPVRFIFQDKVYKNDASEIRRNFERTENERLAKSSSQEKYAQQPQNTDNDKDIDDLMKLMGF